MQSESSHAYFFGVWGGGILSELGHIEKDSGEHCTTQSQVMQKVFTRLMHI